jgi:hypothetical protein
MTENRHDGLNTALLELQALQQRALSMGNNDSESGAIARLIEQVRLGTMPFEDALKKARGIIESKNV